MKLIDGTCTVVEKGAVYLTDKITVNSVLLVPYLTCNLISINNLTRALDCVVKFSSTSCDIQ